MLFSAFFISMMSNLSSSSSIRARSSMGTTATRALPWRLIWMRSLPKETRLITSERCPLNSVVDIVVMMYIFI